ncbi:MAG TPA: YbjQ family protein [Jatrophihabitans sp.]
MLCVTMNEIPGWEIQRVCGEVFGVTVRSRNAFSQMGAGFKSLVGGELQGMTRNVLQSRNEAMTRLFAEAQARGGNALVAMRFDTTELGNNWSEICAYATAVVAVPVTEAAKQTALQLGYGQPGANSGQPGQPGQPGQGHPGHQQPADQQQGWQQPPQQQQPGWEQPGGQQSWEKPGGQQSWGQPPAGQ